MYNLALSNKVLDRLLQTSLTNTTTFRKDNYKAFELYAECVKENTDGYIPINFLVSLRTDRTNEILVMNGHHYQSYIPLFPEKEVPFDDGVLLSGKEFMQSAYYYHVVSDVAMHIEPLPIGAVIYDKLPYVYTQLVLDHNYRDFSLKCGNFVPMTSICCVSGSFESILPLILTKSIGDQQSLT